MKRLMTVAVLCCMLLGAAATGKVQEKVVLKYMTWVNAQGAEMDSRRLHRAVPRALPPH